MVLRLLCSLHRFNSPEPRKKTFLLSIESWLFDRDPYNGLLVCGFNPFEKYESNMGNLFQVGVKIKNI